MKIEVLPPEYEVHSPLSRQGLKGFLLRWICVIMLLDIGFAALSVFGAAERVPPANITFTHELGPYMLYIAFECLYPWSLVVLICELFAYLMLSKGWSWNLCQFILGMAMGAAGAAFAQYLFIPPAEAGMPHDAVKVVLVTGGGALVAFLAGGLHFALFELSIESLPNSSSFPMWWLVSLVLIGATFVGALKQWTSYDPRFRQLMDYRQERISEGGWKEFHDLTPIPDDPHYSPDQPPT